MRTQTVMDSVLVDAVFGKFKKYSESNFMRLIIQDLGNGILSGDNIVASFDKFMNGEIEDIEILNELNDISFVLLNVVVVLVVALCEFSEFVFEELILAVVT